MAATLQREGTTLGLWLSLLGWQIRTEQDGEFVVGVAAHIQADGTTLRVGGCARSDSELILHLFEAAMRALDRDRNTTQAAAA